MSDVNRQELERLLDDLCVGLGLCLPPDKQEPLLSSPPADVDAFTNAVLVAEGLDPVYGDKRLRERVRRMVARAFGKKSPDSPIVIEADLDH